MKRLEMWGGVECTVNRTGDEYRDQLRLTGHQYRERDLDLVAELGVEALRYPVLWERVAPHSPDDFAWGWSDRRFARMRELGVRPIAGLVHHGSGPRYTSLVDEGFAPGLAAFAGAAARRYPWIVEWTPVNEPLTTARFSCLYGHWYPHARSDALFWTALLNQIDAIRLAMRAIREVTPSAQLIQTEDLGRTYATAAMGDQAGFDNARRWMTWDLLMGRVVPGHDLWDHLCSLGLESRARTIADDPSPPDTLGINHYLTSDRFLDQRIQRYPVRCRGGNARREYADVEAIRVLDPPPQGLEGAIDEAWARYRLPVALTEIHNGCTRDEQLRWFRDAWQGAQNARARGVDLRAVTCWALFGSVGWDSLLTGGGRYEAGAFDMRNGTPRATALAELVVSLPGKAPQPAAAGRPGWWRRDLRLRYGAARRTAGVGDHATQDPTQAGGRPILVTGATGTLGQAVAAACRHRGLRYVLTDRSALDVLDRASMDRAFARHRPWAVFNCSGWVRIDEAERESEACMAVNTEGAAALARACDAYAIRSVSFSSDMVFAGDKPSAYRERDEVLPLNVYGRSKVEMEESIQALAGTHLIVRTAAFFSPYDRANFAVHLEDALARGERFAAANDRVVSPTYVPDLCDAVLDLVIDGERGIWHLSNGEALSWAAFARRLAEGLGRDPELVRAVAAKDLSWPAPRPRACALSSERGELLPPLQTAIDRFCSTMRARREAVCHLVP